MAPTSDRPFFAEPIRLALRGKPNPRLLGVVDQMLNQTSLPRGESAAGLEKFSFLDTNFRHTNFRTGERYLI